MAYIGVDHKGGAIGDTNSSGFWYILKGTKENDVMSDSGIYPAGETDHELIFYGYGGNDTIKLANGHKKSAIYGARATITSRIGTLKLLSTAGTEMILFTTKQPVVQ